MPKDKMTKEQEQELVAELEREEEERKRAKEEKEEEKKRAEEENKERRKFERQSAVREKLAANEKTKYDDLMKGYLEQAATDFKANRAASVPLIMSNSGATRVRTVEAMDGRYGFTMTYTITVKGPYWKTLTARKKGIDTPLACTITSLQKAPPKKKENLEHLGLKVLRFLVSHPQENIVFLYDIFLMEQDLYVFHELMDNVLDRFMKRGPVSEERARKWGHDMAAAITFIHSHGIAIRNINHKNVWLSKDLTAKLSGFEYSTLYIDTLGQLVNSKRVHVKEAPHLSPEEILDEPYNAKKADIWGWAGLVVYMLTKQYPPRTELAPFKESTNLGAKVSADGMSLIERCLDHNSAQRPESFDILYDIWFKNFAVIV